MNELQLKEEKQRGANAKMVLGNKEYQNAFLLIRAKMLSDLENTSFKESAERDEIWRKMQTLRWLEATLEQVISDGKLAEHSLASRLKQVIGG